MKNIFGKSAILFTFIALFAFTTGKKKEVGTWTGTDNGKVGSVVFDKDGYAAFVIDGQTLGGKSFTQGGIELSMKYEIDYDALPIQVDFIFFAAALDQEVARMKGIMKFEGKKTMMLALSFDAKGDSQRPDNFDDDNSITLEKTK